MSLENETLLYDRNLIINRPGNQFLEVSRRRRFRFFSALIIFCFVGYLTTSTMFLTENSKINPIVFNSYNKPAVIVTKSSFNKVEFKNNSVLSEVTENKIDANSEKVDDALLTQSDDDTTDSEDAEHLTESTKETVLDDNDDDSSTTLEQRISDQEPVAEDSEEAISDQTIDLPSIKNDSKSKMIESQSTSSTQKSISTTTISNIDNNRLGQTCKIPILDPFDPLLKKALYEEVDEPLCGTKFPLMFETDMDSNLIRLKVPETLKWNDCCYRVITRSGDGGSDPDNTQESGKDCFNITSVRTKIPHEFIGIYCTRDKFNETDIPTPQMVDAFAFIPLKPTIKRKIAKSKPNDQLNVVVFGLDAVSNMNFQRVMPEVHQYLLHNLEAIAMNGYTKIGDNTFPNIIAALTSWNQTEVAKRCEKKNGFFDDCPFIWKNYSKEGYITSYGEDEAWMGIFNYLKSGFRKSPTDYYLRPLARTMGKSIAYDKRGNAKICYGPRISIDFLLDYIKKFANKMGNDKRYFQFIWSTALTHDYVNQGKLGEKSVLKNLKWFKKSGYLNNTVFIFLSDHGIRWGPVRELQQGKVEENLPFLYFVFPKWFKKKYKRAVANLQENTEGLTSPYDTYETLKDILYLHTLNENNLKIRETELRSFTETNIPRGISMFLPVPKFRTCAMSGIAEHYCVCHTSETISTDDPEVKQAANYAVYTLNSYVAKYTTCAYLALSSVMRAQINVPQNQKNIKGQKVFEFAFTTDPGKGMFEATVVKNSNGRLSMSGSISRTNLYGNQSYCISDKEMKKFCYCGISR